MGEALDARHRALKAEHDGLSRYADALVRTHRNLRIDYLAISESLDRLERELDAEAALNARLPDITALLADRAP